MSGSPPKPDDERAELERCMRDLAALNALPSMCVGRSPDESLVILLDALPTALTCNLLCATVPPPLGRRSGWLDGAPLSDAEVDEIVDQAYVDGSELLLYCRDRKLYCLQFDVPVGGKVGRLVAGRDKPLDPATDRLLFRSAANLLGTALQTANVLENARRKDDFIAMLGHELRNPLASILAAIELLQQKTSVGREHRVIEQHTRHVTRLVDDLLDVSRAARGAIELRSEYVELAAVLERAAEIAEPLIRQRRHSLSVAARAGITLYGDTVRLAQIFGNLLTNAAKFTPAEGNIAVSAELAGDRVRVRVKDDGRGLEREHLSRIFEPFVQVDPNLNSLSNGLGLGLAIVRSLVERHGGSITADSAGPGRGSTFTVELPTVVAPLGRGPAEPKARKRSGVKTRVLVVDDNADMTDLLCEALEREGFDTAAAYDAASALEQWRRFKPHAGILDLGLPDMDGCSLAEALRAEHGAEALLIAATGYGQPNDRERAARAGFDLHLVKPVSVSDLIRCLDERGPAPPSAKPIAPSPKADEKTPEV
jgi:signal transduction histidine kinase/CheY-like chemotaxis protein